MFDCVSRFDAARMLQVSTCTVDRYRRKGLLTPLKRTGSNRVWFYRSEVMKLAAPVGGRHD